MQLLSPSIIFVLLLLQTCIGDYTTHYAEEDCKQHSGHVNYTLGYGRRSTAAIVEATRLSSYSTSFNCHVRVGASSPFAKVLVVVKEVDFAKHSCSYHDNYIQIFTKGEKLKNFCKSDYYDASENKVYTSNENFISFLYHTERSARFRSGFKLIFTSYSDSERDDFNFRCSNGRYISKALVCDGHNNCGDHSDECNGSRSYRSYRRIAIIATGILLIIALISGIIWCFSRRNVIKTYITKTAPSSVSPHPEYGVMSNESYPQPYPQALQPYPQPPPYQK